MRFALRILLLFATAAATVEAQPSAPPVRLAIVAEDPAAATAGDALPAELSKRADLQLLERAQIERVYREQEMSAANRDYVKLGQILGADGLLTLDRVSADAGEVLCVRLVAVKPGVRLTSERYPVPLGDIRQWPAGI